MRLPIPDDWNGEAWECYEIHWPNSPLWTAILHGWLSQMARGRTWEESTGSILAAMAIGKEIWSRSTPLTDCAGEVHPPDVISQIEHVAGVCWFGEDETMPCIDISSLIKLENGHLFALNGCCEWKDLGAIADFVEEAISNPPGEDTTPPIPFSACGKAKAINDAIYLVAEAMFANTDALVLPWEAISAVKAAAVPMTLKTNQVLLGLFDALALKNAGYSAEEVFDAAAKQTILCRLARTLAADTGALSQQNMDSINDAFNGALGFEVAVFGAAANAIGLVQLSNISMAGQLVQNADCDCPEIVLPSVPPTDGGPWFTGLITKNSGTGILAITSVSPNMRKIEIRWMVDAPGAQFTEINFDASMLAPADLTTIKFKMTADYPVADWHALPFDRWTNPSEPLLNGVAGADHVAGVANAAGYTFDVNFVQGKPTSLFGNSARFLPQDTRELGATAVWSIEIISWAL